MSVRYRSLWLEPEAAALSLVDVMGSWVVEASRPFADWYFGDPDVAAEIIGEWMCRPTSELYVGRSLVADTDGDVAGCVIALPGAELAGCRRADFAAFCSDLGTGPEADAVIEEVVAASAELFPAVSDDDLYISRVAVNPARRGHGVGRMLVRQAIEAFGDGGLRACRLDVSADNPAAIRAYEAAGLVIIATSDSPTAGMTYCAMGAKL